MAENNPFPGENNTGHFWDDNLRELKNPPPRWWMIAFWLSVAWWVLYTVLYPSWPMPWQTEDGDGYTKGLLGWTSIKEYKQGMEQVAEVRAEYEAQIADKTAEEILADPGLTQYTLASAKVLFGDYCAACHGSGGQGNPGYPVLADDDWLYGGSLAKIKETITIGRKGVMTAHKGLPETAPNHLTDAEIDQLAQFVVDMSEGKPGTDEQWALYKAKQCNTCHGEKANGVLAELPNGDIISVGAANLTDAIWRFQPGGLESARYTISYGVNYPNEPNTRNAVMPAFSQDQADLATSLTPDQIKKLAVYVDQLSPD